MTFLALRIHILITLLEFTLYTKGMCIGFVGVTLTFQWIHDFYTVPYVLLDLLRYRIALSCFGVVVDYGTGPQPLTYRRVFHYENTRNKSTKRNREWRRPV